MKSTHDEKESALNAQWQPILKCGAEGGSLTLMGRWWLNGWEFHRNLHDCSLMLIDEGNAIQHDSDTVGSWRKAMSLMDRYPWHRLHPLSVHPEFRAKALKSWRHRCKKDGSGPSFNDHAWREMLGGNHLGIVMPE